MYTIDNSSLFRRFRRLLLRWSVVLLGSALAVFSFMPSNGQKTKNMVISFSVSTIDTLPDFAKVAYAGVELGQALETALLAIKDFNKANEIIELNVSGSETGVTVNLSGPNASTFVSAQNQYVKAIKSVLINQINNQTRLFGEGIDKRLVAAQKKLATLDIQLSNLSDRGSALVSSLILERNERVNLIESIQEEFLTFDKFRLEPGLDLKETVIESPVSEPSSDYRALAASVMVVLLELGVIFFVSLRRNRVFERADIEAFTGSPLIGLLPKEQFKPLFPQIRAVLNLAIAHRDTDEIVVIPIDNFASSSLALRDFISDSALNGIQIKIAPTGADGITAIKPGGIIVLIVAHGHSENSELQKVAYDVRLCSESIFGTIMVDVPNQAVRKAVKFLPSLKATSQ